MQFDLKKVSIVLAKDAFIGVLNCNLFGVADFFFEKRSWLESFLVTFVKNEYNSLGACEGI